MSTKLPEWPPVPARYTYGMERGEFRCDQLPAGVVVNTIDYLALRACAIAYLKALHEMATQLQSMGEASPSKWQLTSDEFLEQLHPWMRNRAMVTLSSIGPLPTLPEEQKP